jgi:hypothetical protein
LRRQVLAVETFTMTDEELQHAHSAARAAAAAVRPAPVAAAVPVAVPAPAPVHPTPTPTPRHAPAPAQARAHASPTRAVHPRIQAHKVSETNSYTTSSEWSHASDYMSAGSRDAEMYSSAESSYPSSSSPQTLETPTPMLIDTADSYALVATSSRSSSSGDVSLPPTPDFNPADRQPAIARWDYVSAKQSRSDMRYPAPISPISGEFRLL